MTPWSRRRLAAGVVLALLLVAARAPADESPAPRLTTIPSFSESPGCGGPDGIRGPFASQAGNLPNTEPVLGPWGDFYGRDIAEVRSQLVRKYLPSPTGDVGVWVHSRVAPALAAVIRNLEREAAAGRTYAIRSWDTWSYRAATIPPGRYLSFHAVGAAIDINATTNPYRLDNVLITDMPDWFVKAWTDAGWCWGGHWQEKKDPMHFSWEGPPATRGYRTPAPFPPRTSPAAFTRTLSFSTALGPAAADGTRLLADLDRDGAADAVEVRPWTPAGHLGVEAARAIHGFETCTTAETTGWPAPGGAAVMLADDGDDGRPDLWVADASGATVVVSIYSFASGFTLRRGPVATAIPAGTGLTFLVGDHDRDRHADLYVLRPGTPATFEIWRGRRFTSALSVALPFTGGEGWRYALGERDGDGIPDLFALEPGDDPIVHIVPGASGFTGPDEAITLEGPAHEGGFAVEDLDGDGRGDLYFLDRDGTLTVRLGGKRGATTDDRLVYWFFEGHDRDWTAGAGCIRDAGSTFGALAVAGTSTGTATAYVDPASGGWVLRGRDAEDGPWVRDLTGEVRGLVALPTPDGERLAVLHVEDGAPVSLLTPDGALVGRIRFGRQLMNPDGPSALVVSGAPALGVTATGPKSPVLAVRDLTGALVAEVPLSLTPIAAAAYDGDADGNSEIVLLGTTAGDTRLQVLSLDGRVQAEASLPAGGQAEALALLSGGRPAVLWRSAETGRTRVLIYSAGLVPAATYRMPPDSGIILSAVGGDFVAAFRTRRNGTVWVVSRDAATGDLHYREGLPAGFDPFSAAATTDGALVLAAQRRGDGAILLDRRAPDGGSLAQETYRPG